MAEQRDRLIGTQIRGYTIVDIIGRGGMGAVYRAYQESVDRHVALKVVLPEYANNPTFIRNFQTEAKTIARLEGLNVITLHDFWRDNDGAFLIMRLMERSLRDALKSDGAWDIDKTLRLLDQMAIALSVAHRNHIIHRDLKPENILLDTKDNAFLADFGLTNEMELGANQYGYTPAYAAPEQIKKEPVTPQTDIYSLAILIYEVLAGQRPFTDSTISDLQAKHLNAPLPSLYTMRPQLPHAVDDVMEKATAKNPLDRYTNAQDFADALRRAVYGTTGGDTSTIKRSSRQNMTLMNPYRGLQAFEQVDADNFFGRDALTDRLLNRIGIDRFLAVVGPSGSGKSSVVKAGLIPKLRRGALPDAKNWLATETTPSTSPFEKLAEALGNVLLNPPSDMGQQLASDVTALNRLVRDYLPEKNAQLVLVIDQFEEIFTLTSKEDDRKHYMDSLVQAVTVKDSRLRVVITLRADFYDRPLLYPVFGELVRTRMESVTVPSIDELEQAIVKPAEKAGVKIEAGLVNAITAAVSEQIGVLPLLQYALTQLFEKQSGGIMTLRNYNTIEGVAGALANHADEIYNTLKSDDGQEFIAPEVLQHTTRQLFLRLVNIGEETGSATRRRARRTELIAPNEPNPAMVQVLDVFGKARLLTFDNDPITREPTIEVAHEALLRSWKRLREWIETSRNDLRIQRRLAVDANEWRNQGFPTGLLATDERLLQYEDLATRSTISLNKEERSFVEAAKKRRESEQEIKIRQQEEQLRLAEEARSNAEEARKNAERVAEEQKRNAEQQTQAAEQQRRAAGRLRVASGLAGVVAILAIIAMVSAITSQNDAVVSKNEAFTQAALAVTNENRANAESTNANNALVTATLAQGQALLSANEAQTQAALAVTNENRANAESTNANNALVTATLAQGQALLSANEAQTQAALAVTNENRANAESTNANNALVTATLAQGQALLSANEAQTQAALAVTNENRANVESTNANNALVTATLAQGQALLSANEAQTQAALATSAQGQALLSANEAQTQAALAVTNENRANAESTNANNAQATAQQNANEAQTQAALARTAEGQALLSANEAQTQGAIANNALVTATLAQGQAQSAATAVSEERNLSFSQNLAAQAELLYNAGDYQLASALALEANKFADAPPSAQRVLSITAYGGPRDIVELVSPKVVYCPYIRSNRNVTERWATTNDNNAIVLYGLTRFGKLIELVQLQTHTVAVNAITCNADGTLIASADIDGNILIWERNLFGGYQSEPLEVDAEIGDAQALVSPLDTSQQATLTPSPTLTPLANQARNRILNLAFSPDSTALLVGYERVQSEQGRLALWDITGNASEQVTEFIGHSDAVSSAMFSFNGEQIVSASLNGEIILWDVLERDILRRVQYPFAVNSVAYDVPDENGDNTRIISAATDGVITIWDATTLQEVATLKGHTASVNQALYNPFDSENRYVISASDDRNIILWDAISNKELNRYRAHEAPVTDTALGGGYVVSVAGDATLMLWDVVSGAEITRLERDNTDEIILEQQRVDYAAERALTASGTQLYLWTGVDNISFTNLKVLTGTDELKHTFPIQAVAFGSDGIFQGVKALSGDAGGYLILWDTQSTDVQPNRKWAVSTDEGQELPSVLSIAFSIDGQTVAVGLSNNTIQLWDVDSATLITTLTGHTYPVQAVSFASDGRIASGSSGGEFSELFLWTRAEDGTYPSQLLSGHTGSITSVAFNPNSRTLVSASEDRTLISWDIDTTSSNFGLAKQTFRQHTRAVRSVDFAGDNASFRSADYDETNEIIISASDDQTVVIWDVATGSPISVLTGHTDGVNGARLNVSGDRAVSSGDDGRLIVWQIDTLETLIAYINSNRYIDPLRDLEGCAIRQQYGLVACNAEGKVPTSTPTPFMSATPTLTITPTLSPSLTPTPTPTLVLGQDQLPDTVMAVLVADRTAPRTGYEAERRDWSPIDLSYRSYVTTSSQMQKPYQDFVVHANLAWGSGSLQDRCGIGIRKLNNDNFYQVSLDQLGNVYLVEYANGEFSTEANDDPANTYQLQETNTRDGAEIVLVVQGENVQVFINRDWSNPTAAYDPIIFDGITIPKGYVTLAGSVREFTLASSCMFTDVWIVDLASDTAPAPTPIPTAPVPLSTSTLQNVASVSTTMLEVSNRLPNLIAENAGYQTEQNSRFVMDMTNNAFGMYQILPIQNPQSYRAFTFSTQMGWGKGDEWDECGVTFRYVDLNNFYGLTINRLGEMWFLEVEDGRSSYRLIPNSLVRRERDAKNELLLVAVDIPETSEGDPPSSRFVIFLNGQYVGELQDDTHNQGSVWFTAAKYSRRGIQSYCTFERSWVWNLDANAPPTPAPRATPIQQDTVLTLGTPQEGELAIGGRDVWTYESSGNETVNIRIDALRPANDVPIESSIARELLDVEVLVTLVGADGVTTTFVGSASDIISGQNSNAQLLNLALATAGTYRIEVFSKDDQTVGKYTLVVESATSGGNS
jgi:WD40 repeat protein/serine/threonine protein kinase